MKLEIGGEIMNVISAYAAQVGCEREVKGIFGAIMIMKQWRGFLLKKE